MCEVAPLDSRMENKDLRLNVIRDLKAKSGHLVSKRRGDGEEIQGCGSQVSSALRGKVSEGTEVDQKVFKG